MADSLDEAIDALIGEIAVKHGVAVSRDDPLLIMQTIFRHLSAQGVAAQEEALERFKEDMEGVSLRWGVDAKGKADRVLTTALAESREAMTQAIQDGARAAVSAVQSELSKTQAALSEERLATRRYSIYAIAASSLSAFVIFSSVCIWLLFK
ncbi:conjugal transfer protein TraM [Burkholderia gladioli]|uniref:conjugal transfer protein TraM n=1 Tax=Burkholderia gladioli TaxID=28095 RepID=UPI002862AF69|nr:conjugal transfer protein TraM [Burkholderia gladioli]MDR8093135.1 conjugal transfer protein TraM [Burkholderia gladioli]